jgi:peptide/nickel transport system substrate-binding protein
VIVASSTAACNAGGGSATPASGAPLVVDTVFNLKTADPGRMYEPAGNLILRPVYESLLTFDGGDVTKVVPSLAGLPEVSPDATRFTFTLRPGAVFADGTPVTAADIVFSLNRGAAG